MYVRGWGVHREVQRPLGFDICGLGLFGGKTEYSGGLFFFEWKIDFVKDSGGLMKSCPTVLDFIQSDRTFWRVTFKAVGPFGGLFQLNGTFLGL